MKAFLKSSHLFITIFFITTGCQRELNWYAVATGSLKDSSGLCMPAKISGTFYNGIAPGKDTAYIELQVNVFTTGVYSIFTNTQNGLKFADSGTFDSIGLHIIKLKPIGIPGEPQTSVFTACFNNSCCAVNVNIKNIAQTDTVPLNSWSYTDVEKHITYKGPINATQFVLTPISSLLALRKQVTLPGDTSFEIGLSFPTKDITTGSFTTDSVNAISQSLNGICINCAWQVPYKLYSVLTTIVVTDYNPATRLIKGTFAGTTIDWNYHVSPIKNGVFNAIVK